MRRNIGTGLLLVAIMLTVTVGASAAESTTLNQGSVPVVAAAETTPVPSDDDAADDAAIWVHPTDPGSSLVIGTDKQSGLGTYELDGTQFEFLFVGDCNNVDVRYDFPLGGGFVDIVAAGNRTDQSIDVFRVDPDTRTLTDVSAGPLLIGVEEAYGFCLYRSPITGLTYAFVNDKNGDVEQYELVDAGGGLIDAVLVRTIAVGGQTEGMVADDEYAVVYIGEESHGIWRYGAEPSDGPERVEVDTTDGPNLTADVEGLTIYYTSDGAGYLLASSQGSNSFAVYERTAPPGLPNQWLKGFEIVDGAIDGCAETDGIDVMSASLGAAFPLGVFVAQDGVHDGGNQNYKLVPWESIAETGFPQLVIDTSWDPRGGPGVAQGACCIGGACDVLTEEDCGAQGGEYEGDDIDCGDAVCQPPIPPAPATSPSPVDGASGISVDTVLSWSAGEGAVSHDVYVGTDPTPDASEFQGNQSGTVFDPIVLQPSTTYFWRIDEVNAAGTTTGDVWSFGTADPPQPPAQATNPSPAHGASNTTLTVQLAWTAGALADAHDVYFGTDPSPDASEFQGSQSETSFDPGPLQPLTSYFWRIDEVNEDGTTPGDVWSFTTGDGLVAIEFLAVSSFTTEQGADFDVPIPDGTSEGDYLLMVVGKEREGDVFTPEGWTVVDEGLVRNNKARLEVFSRVAGPDEPASYAVSSDEDKKTFAAILRYCCADAAMPIDAVAVANGNSDSPTSPSVTTTVADAMIVRVFAAKDDDLANDPHPPGHEGRFALLGGDKVSGAAADTIQAAPGATGTAAFSLDESREWRALTIALSPGDGPSTPCPADVDGDGVVAVLDLVEVLVHWGEAGGPADVNGDGEVAVLDLIAVIASWGTCPP